MKVMAGIAGFSKLRTLDKGVQGAVDSLQNSGLSKEGLAGVGNTRIQATLGSQSSKSVQDSLSGKNEASSIDANNLVLNIAGKGKDSDFTVTGSDINLVGDLYNNVEGDVIYQAASSTGYDRTSNKSNGFGIGVYASTQSGAGITANANKAKGYGNGETTTNANKAKGYGNGETTTNANSHINVGGTTYQNIGGNLVLDGAVVKGDYATGHIGGGIIATSRQDTAKYDGKQKNVGFSADVSMQGIPQNVSINGGKSNLSMDLAQVTEQTGLQYQSSDMVVDGKSSFNGAYFTTATPQANQTQFKGGLEVSDMQNHIHYHGQSISGGIGAGLNANKTGLASPSISGIGYGKVGDGDTSTTYGAVTGMAGQSQVTNKTVGILNEPLKNTFNAEQLNAELNNQTQITQAFDTERRNIRTEYTTKAEAYRKEAKEAQQKGNDTLYKELEAKAEKIDDNLRLFDGITSALYAPNSNGILGDTVRVASPQVAYKIGQYFKGNDALNGLDGGDRNGEGSAPHILAHGILAAAVSVETGNDPTTGALSAMGAEATANAVSHYLFGVDKPSELTAEQKQTVTSIVSLAGIGVGATTGDVANAVNAGEVGKVGVENNYITEVMESYYTNRPNPKPIDLNYLRKVSSENEANLQQICLNNPSSQECTNAIRDSLWYNSRSYLKHDIGDAKISSNNVLDILYNGKGAQNLFVKRIHSIDDRANFFGTNHRHYKYNNIDIRWFGGAEEVSRACVTGLGADGCGSYITFGVGNLPYLGKQIFFGNPDLYTWRKEAGDALIIGGFDNFKHFYNNRPNAMQWDIKQLYDEQTLLQPIHEKYLLDKDLFQGVSGLITDVDILDYKSRIRYGCKLLGYSEGQGCKP